jgi:hypothetical protein
VGLGDGWTVAGALLAAIDEVAQATADQAALVSGLRLDLERAVADAAESLGRCRRLEQHATGLSRSVASMRADMVLWVDGVGLAGAIEAKGSNDAISPSRRALANLHLERMSPARRQIVLVMWDEPDGEWSPRRVWLRLREDVADAPSTDSVQLTMRRMAADKRMQLERVGHGRYRLGPMLRLGSGSAV